MVFCNLDAILFDLDGTLIEPSIDFDDMKRRILDLIGEWDVDASLWKDLPVLEIIAHVMAQLQQRGNDQTRRFTESANETIIEIEQEAAGRVLPYPGVLDMVQELEQDGYAVGIVTRNCREAVERVLARTQLPHRVLLTRDDVRHVKPDPRHLQDALDAMGMAGCKAMMCGDHPMDIAAGRGIGAVTVGVLRPGITAEYMAEAAPDLILARVTDLPRHLERCG